jgi:hypothetical protein
LASFKKHQQKLKLEVLTHYAGGKTPSCECCGEDNLMLLTLDHTKNDGAAHRRQVGSSYVYPWVKQHGFPDGFQVLCIGCNHGKQLNGGTCCPAHAEHVALKWLRTFGLVVTAKELVRRDLIDKTKEVLCLT